MGFDKKQVTHEIKKHAATIHCSNTLSLLQRKLSNALLYHAYKELLLKDEHEISIKQLCKLISYHGNNHAVIKDALKGMLATVIEWNLVNDTTGQEDWTASSMLASVCLRGPAFFYAYSPRMKQLLHSPSMFGKINLYIQSQFKSSYGLALYENCVRYRGLAHTKWFEIDLFRKLMGVPPGKYTVFRDFKRRVLDKSIQEVNTYSDLFVESEIHKEGRQVIKIRFNLKERAKKTRLGTKLIVDAQSSSLHAETREKLLDVYGLSTDQCDQLMTEYTIDFIIEKMTIIETSSNYIRGRVKSPAAYLFSALKNNYQTPKSPTRKTIEPRKTVLEQQKRQRIVDLIKKDYESYREQMVDGAIEDLSPNDKQEFLDGFYHFAETTIQTVLKLQRRKYTQQTVLKSPQIKAVLRQYALQNLRELKTRLISLEQFVETLPESKRQAWHQSKVETGSFVEVIDL